MAYILPVLDGKLLEAGLECRQLRLHVLHLDGLHMLAEALVLILQCEGVACSKCMCTAYLWDCGGDRGPDATCTPDLALKHAHTRVWAPRCSPCMPTLRRMIARPAQIRPKALQIHGAEGIMGSEAQHSYPVCNVVVLWLQVTIQIHLNRLGAELRSRIELEWKLNRAWVQHTLGNVLDCLLEHCKELLQHVCRLLTGVQVYSSSPALHTKSVNGAPG